MPNTLRIKRRSSGSPGAPASLANAELAYNEVDDTLYYGKGSGGAGGTATTIEAIGGAGAVVTRSTTQTITGAKDFSSAIPTISASLAAGDNSTRIATTAFVKAQAYLTSGGSIATAAAQDLTLGGTIGAVTAVLANSGVTAGSFTKVTVDAKGRVTYGASVAASDIPTLTSAKISDFDTQVRLSRLDQMAVPTAALNLNGQRISVLGSPSLSQDAATKGYVDSVAQGIDAKQSVKAATTANVTLSGAQTIDGIALVADDRVLVKNQSSAAQNGLYTVQPGSWVRAADADLWDELRSAFVFVEQGSTQGDTGWTCTVDAGGTLETTSITWVQFSGAGSYTAGSGLSLSGTQFSVSSSYTGQSTITTVGTVSTGTWQASAIALAYGGTGATTAAGARTSLDVPSTAGSGASGTWGISVSGNAATVTNGVYTTGNQSIAGQKTFTDAAYFTNGYVEIRLASLVDSLSFKNGSGNLVLSLLAANGKINFSTGSGAASGFNFSTNSTSNAVQIADSGSITTVSSVTATQFNGSGAGLTSATVPIAAHVAGDYSGKITSGTYSVSITGNASTVTNGVYTSGSYSDPSWITAISTLKLAGDLDGGTF